MAGTLKFTDLVTFSYLDQNWTRVKDDYEGAFKPPVPGQPHNGAVGNIPDGTPTDMQQAANGGLNVQIAATHAGIITRNNGFYLPERMRKGTETFTKDFFKPVLLHHEDHQDPVGRVIDAAYVDTSGAIQDKYRGLEVKNSVGEVVGTINDALIRDFSGGAMPFGQQVDVVRNILRDSLLDDKAYAGLGYIKILANIADPDAIQKLLDGRYSTGSVGASTNKAVCSVCKSDWTKGGPCEHKPGGVYDDAKCFIIAGDLAYDEYSFVNVPADRHSRVLQLDYNGNKAEIEVADDYKGRIYEVQLQFPQYDSDTKEEKGMAQKKDAKAKAESNLEIQDAVTQNPAPDAEPQTEGAQEVADSATQTAEGETAEGTEGTEQIADEAAEGEETSIEDKRKCKKKKNKMKDGEEGDGEGEETVKDFVAHVIDSDEALSAEDEEAFYDQVWAAAQDCFKDGEFTLEQLGVEDLEDAKLSTEKRKKLPKSAFCGPNRSFPANDCAHVTAARRLIGKYKGEGSKDSIMKCVDRKAKLLGCDTKKKDEVKDSVETQDGSQHARIMQIILAAFEENRWSPDDEKPLTDDDKKTLTDILKRLANMVGKDSFSGALYEGKLAQDETALCDEVEKLEEQVVDLRDRLDASQKEYHLLFGDMEELQDSLVTEKAATRQAKEARLTDLVALRDHKVDEQDYTELSDGDLQSEIDRTLEVVDMGKITDKLGDGMSRVPEGEVDDPSGIQDNAKTQKRKVTLDSLKKIQEEYYMLRLSRGQQAAEMYLADKRARGLLPQDLDDIEGGSN